MYRLARLLSALAYFLSAACYHATVETGATPSNVVIHKSFASSWIFGLVPPSTIETQNRCPHGPAKVETQLSFVNQLVSFLTLSIYTPMEIKVTCAAPGTQQGAVRPDELLNQRAYSPSAAMPRPADEESQVSRPPTALPAGGARSNDQLLSYANFRQAMTDILRMRVAASFRELRQDTLTVDLGDGSSSASADYNLGRLYLAYQQTIEDGSDGVLELLRDDQRVGLYTKDGLRWDPVRAPAYTAPEQGVTAPQGTEPPGLPSQMQSEDRSAWPQRRGFWFNGGLGYGSLGCDDCDGREGGLSGLIGLGGTVSQKVLLGVTSSGWTKSESGVTLTVGTLTGMIRFYPSNTGRFFLLGGLGLGSIHVDLGDFGSETETGGGALLGLGYDIKLGDKTSMTLYWNGFAARTENADANVGQLGLSITAH